MDRQPLIQQYFRNQGLHSELTELPDRKVSSIVKDPLIRRYLEGDPIPQITRLLHEAYAPLAAMNLRFTATHQDDEVTRGRLTRGISWIAELDGEIAATVSLYSRPSATGGCSWYDEPGVWFFGQFAVKPELQRAGLGTRLVRMLEHEAFTRGAAELALDTAEPAHHLIRWYKKLGFRFIQFQDWSSTNYRSVVMSKTLGVESHQD